MTPILSHILLPYRLEWRKLTESEAVHLLHHQDLLDLGSEFLPTVGQLESQNLMEMCHDVFLCIISTTIFSYQSLSLSQNDSLVPVTLLRAYEVFYKQPLDCWMYTLPMLEVPFLHRISECGPARVDFLTKSVPWTD